MLWFDITTHLPLSQQPLGQLAALQLTVDEQMPPLQVSLVTHILQTFPPVPQDCALCTAKGMQVFPEQQPAGQVLRLQLETAEHRPKKQPSPKPHAPQSCAPMPHAEFDCIATPTQEPLRQQPVEQLLVVQVEALQVPLWQTSF